MNLILLKKLTLYGGVISAIIGLLLIIWRMSGKGEEPASNSDAFKRQRRFMAVSWGIFAIPLVVILILLGGADSGTGQRGALFSILMGTLIPVFISSIEAHMYRYNKGVGNKSLIMFAASPLAASGFGLLYISTVVNFYGLKADNLWMGFTAGIALGIFIVGLSSKISLCPAVSIISKSVESVFYLAIAIPLSTMLGFRHFEDALLTKAFIPVLLLMGIFLSALISAVPFVVKSGKKIRENLPVQVAMFLAIFLGISIFLVLKFSLNFDYNYPIMVGAISSLLFFIMSYGSATSTGKKDLSTGAMGVLMVIGGIWFSFKWAQGFGITLYLIGLLSISPLVSAVRFLELQHYPEPEDNNKAKKNAGKSAESIVNSMPGIYLRAITLAGIPVILYTVFRIFVEMTRSISYILDLTYNDTLTGLVAGIFISLALGGFNLMGDRHDETGKEGNIVNGIFYFVFSVVLTAASVIAAGILFKLSGAGAFIVGMSVAGFIGYYSYMSLKDESGLFRASLSSLWIAGAVLVLKLTPYHEVPYQMTRAHKKQVLIGMILLAVVAYLLAHFQNRKAKNDDGGKNDNDDREEKSLKVKSV